MFIKQSTAVRNLVFRMLSTTDGFTPTTGLTVTVTLSKNGGAFAAAAGAVTEIANGYYQVAANATDSNTLGGLILYGTGTGAKANAVFEVVAFDPRSATNLGLSGLPTASPGAANGLLIAGSNAAVNFDDGLVIAKSSGTAFAVQGVEQAVAFIGGTGYGLAIQSSGTIATLAILGSSALTPGVLIESDGDAFSIASDSGNGFSISGANGGIQIIGSADNAVRLFSAQKEALKIVGNGVTDTIVVNGAAFGKSCINIVADLNGNGVTISGNGTGKDTITNIVGNITGNLSGSVASVTGNLGGNVGGNVNGFVHALDAGAIVANTIADGALTAAKFGTGFIVAGSFAASADTHLAGAIGPGVWTVSSASPTANTFGDLLANFGQSIETGITFKQSIRAMLAVAAGIVTGGGTTSPVFKNPAGTATRVTATVDGSGNRSSVTITA